MSIELRECTAAIFEGTAPDVEQFRKDGKIRNVLVMRSESRNGYRYTGNAMRAIGERVEGAPAYVDHPMDSRGRPIHRSRSLNEKLGTFSEGTSRGEGEIRATLTVLKHMRPLAESFIEDPKAAGFSIRASGEFSKDGKLVESVTRLHGIELVDDPATTGGLYESMHKEENPDARASQRGARTMDLAELKKEHPKVYAAALAEGKDAAASESQENNLREQNKNLTKENDDLKAAGAIVERKEFVDAQIAEAKLPKHLVSEAFRTMLVEAADGAAVKALIADRVQLAKNTVAKGGGAKSTGKSTDLNESVIEEGKSGDEKPSLNEFAEGMTHGGDDTQAIIESRRASADK